MFRQFSRFALAAILGLSVGGVQAADNTETTSQEQKKGSTRVHGKTWITDKENGTVVCTIEVTTKKSGLNGTGWGCTQAVFFDAKGNVVLHFEHTQTVGAKVPQGVNEGESQKTFTIRRAKADEIAYWATFTDIEDGNGLPKGIEKLKETVQKSLDDLGGLGKLDPRKQAEKNGVILFKRR